jgi:chorismate synthase
VIDCRCVSVAAAHRVQRGAALDGIPASILLRADGVRDAMRTRSRVDSKLSKMKAEDYVKRADRAKAKRACHYLNDFN